MIARRTKNAKLGLLPRMDARPRKGGGYTYRYLTHDRRYIPLGKDRAEAIRQVLTLEYRAPDTGTVGEMVRAYMASSRFTNDLSKGSQDNYLLASKEVLRVFATMAISDVRPQHIARYLRVERVAAPVRANREMAFLSSAFQFGIEQGMAETNPCRMVRRNTERPRSRCPSWEEIESLCELAKNKGPSSHVVGLMAKFAALTGRRGAEFRNMRRTDIRTDGIAVSFAKAKAGEALRTGLIGWTPALRAVFTELASVVRHTSTKRTTAVESVFVWTNRDGQPYTTDGFKAMWTKIMADWLAAEPGRVKFNFHDLRAYYVTVMVGAGENPETHSNPATTKRVYDRRRVVNIKSSG